MARLAELDGGTLALVLTAVDQGFDYLSETECDTLAAEGLLDWEGERLQWTPDGWGVARLVTSQVGA